MPRWSTGNLSKLAEPWFMCLGALSAFALHTKLRHISVAVSIIHESSITSSRCPREPQGDKDRPRGISPVSTSSKSISPDIDNQGLDSFLMTSMTLAESIYGINPAAVIEDAVGSLFLLLVLTPPCSHLCDKMEWAMAHGVGAEANEILYDTASIAPTETQYLMLIWGEQFKPALVSIMP
ncbi:hypothetical protein SODALDRAFT_356020 [Sodiomyces alkalinus F11]|uniref:Uncharacterized protein n=1 Tax=Sodiomyces alkalinus (strain CBS 110278 / VKM F-3762 / F11) TaxID=1314773 RepID=A0A3N2QAN5_SODAK|nr:hypothetical protein SODALDRAFT_356020 [Sodiomyces alkalinus F11]ROT43796.1 hypothetical protein SODALDRAFT_356020 [Sodiomyces alkalinus F11]